MRRKPVMLVTVMLVAVAMVVGVGCGAGSPIEAEPVFALDRNQIAEIAPVDPDRGEVVSAGRLQVLLQALLTDHVTLSNEAMRLRVDGRDPTATIAELTANTDAMTGAIGLVHGPAGAHAFDQLWTNHIEFFNEYATALAAGSGTDEVRDRLEHYEHDFADFLNEATADNLALNAALQVLHGHVEQMLGQADAWAGGDHARSIEIATTGFDHAAAIAAALAASIVAQHPANFPGDLAAAAACVGVHLEARRLATATAEVAAARAAGGDVWIAAAEDEQQRVADAVAQQLGADVAVDIVEQTDEATAEAADPVTARREALVSAETLAGSTCQAS